MLLETDYSKPASAVIERAVEVLKSGGVIAYPTDTVYGIGSILSKESVDRIRNIKGRAGSAPFSLAFPSAEMVRHYAVLDEDIEWSGGKTYILEKTGNTPDYTTSNLPTVGVRVFESGIVHEILKRLGEPIVTTSANISGQPAPKNVIQIPDEIKSSVDLVLDCGDCFFGRPSKIIDLTKGGAILRK